MASVAATVDSQARAAEALNSAGIGYSEPGSGSVVTLAQNDSFYDVQDVPIYSRDWVSELQSRMKDAGFDPGTESGAFTEQTRDTIMEVQRQYGLQVNGQPTPSLMRKLRSLALQPGQSG